MKAAILVATLMLAMLITACGGPGEQLATSAPTAPAAAADAAAPTGAQPTEPDPLETTEAEQAAAGPPAEAATPASITRKPAQKPAQKTQPTYTIADLAPGTELPALFGQNLTDEERSCMLPELQDGRMATNVLNSGAQILTPTQERILRETLKCLKQENLVRFMMDTSTGPDQQVSEESISCALDALATTDLERTIVPSKIEGGAENALMTGLAGMLGTTMIISYCLSDEEWARMERGRLEPGRLEPGRLEPGRLEPGRLEPGRPETGQLEPGLHGAQDRTALRCAIDAQGGPRAYMENMMDPSPEAMDKMMEADISCQPEEGAGQPNTDADRETGPQADPDEDQGGGEKTDAD